MKSTLSSWWQKFMFLTWCGLQLWINHNNNNDNDASFQQTNLIQLIAPFDQEVGLFTTSTLLEAAILFAVVLCLNEQ